MIPDGWFGNSIANATTAEVLASGGDTYYSGASDFFFQVVFVATAMSIVSGAVAERMKLWAFLAFAVVLTGFIYPMQALWSWGGGFLGETVGYSDYAGSGIVHLCGATAALSGVLFLGHVKASTSCRWQSKRDSWRQHASRGNRYVHPVDGLVRFQRRF